MTIYKILKAMELQQHFMIQLLVPLIIQLAMGQGTLPSSGEPLDSTNEDCFPGLTYIAESDTCMCMNEMLFGEGIMCQTSPGKLSPFFFCITSDWEDPDQVVGGVCPYHPPKDQIVLPQLKPSQEEMNSLFCQDSNRSQTLCGKCADNYGLSINTYDFECLPSSQCKTENILLYLLSTFGPLTVFYCLIFLLQVNIAASYLFPYVTFAQTVSLYIIYVQKGLLLAFNSYTMAETFNKILISLYSIWTLDVLTIFMPPICINEQLSSPQAISLQYIIALYPLLMILLSYLMVELYDRNYRIVVWMFLPIKKCLLLLHVKLDPISSLLTTFATFFFLSFTRMTIISLMLLSYTNLLSSNGTVVRRVFLYDATIEYFGPDHLPYALLAFVVGMILIFPSVLLVLLYPTRIFQTRLRFLCSFKLVQALTAFMEIYQGHFKDGTEGNRDYRYFAGCQLLMRLIIFAVFFPSLQYIGLSFLCILILSVTWSLLILLFTPYKKDIHNRFEGIMTFYGTIVMGIVFYNLILELLQQNTKNSEIVLYVSMILPALVAMGFCCIWMCRQSLFPRLHNKIKLQQIRTHLDSSTGSPSIECRQLEVTRTDISQCNSTEYTLVSDRFPNSF